MGEGRFRIQRFHEVIGIQGVQVVGREFPFDVGLVPGTPFLDFDTAFGDMREVLQGLDGFDEILDNVMAVVDGPVFLDFRCQCRF